MLISDIRTSHLLVQHRWFPRVLPEGVNVLLIWRLLEAASLHVLSFLVRLIHVFIASQHFFLRIHVLVLITVILGVLEDLLLVVVVWSHRLRLLIDVHVIRFQLLRKGVLDDAAHTFELATERFQLSTARRDRLLQNWNKNIIRVLDE